MRPNDIQDGKWNSGFLRFARRTNSPILPVYIKARNSSLFYSASAIYKPLSALLLVQEMFAQRAHTISIRMGEMIPNDSLRRTEFTLRAQVRMIKKHIYQVGRGKPGVFNTEKSIAHPQPRQRIKTALKQAKVLGSTRDVCEAGGTEFLAFNVDPDFSNCIDGLVCAELDRLKPAKRKRYIENQNHSLRVRG